jgi:hypothetical protein
MVQNIENTEIVNAVSQEKPVSFLKYLPALMVALLKDLLDLVLIGSLPGVGTVVTFVFSLLIFLLLLLSGSSKKYSTSKKSMILLAGTLTEGMLFGLNFLPIETLTVLAIYIGDKKSQKK